MDNPYSDIMSRQPDKKLIRLVTVERDSRDPLAVEAAEAELAKRGVDEFQIRRTENEYIVNVISGEETVSDNVPRWMRLSHQIIDLICFWLCWLGLNYIVIRLLEDPFLISISVWFSMVFSFVGYFVVVEWKFQRTLGMMLTNCHIIDSEGGKPDFDKIMKRTLCRLLPFDAIVYLFSGTMLHDNFSGTVVVRNLFMEDEGLEKAFIPDSH